MKKSLIYRVCLFLLARRQEGDRERQRDARRYIEKQEEETNLSHGMLREEAWTIAEICWGIQGGII